MACSMHSSSKWMVAKRIRLYTISEPSPPPRLSRYLGLMPRSSQVLCPDSPRSHAQILSGLVPRLSQVSCPDPLRSCAQTLPGLVLRLSQTLAPRLSQVLCPDSLRSCAQTLPGLVPRLSCPDSCAQTLSGLVPKPSPVSCPDPPACRYPIPFRPMVWSVTCCVERSCPYRRLARCTRGGGEGRWSSLPSTSTTRLPRTALLMGKVGGAASFINAHLEIKVHPHQLLLHCTS